MGNGTIRIGPAYPSRFRRRGQDQTQEEMQRRAIEARLEEQRWQRQHEADKLKFSSGIATAEAEKDRKAREREILLSQGRYPGDEGAPTMNRPTREQRLRQGYGLTDEDKSYLREANLAQQQRMAAKSPGGTPSLSYQAREGGPTMRLEGEDTRLSEKGAPISAEGLRTIRDIGMESKRAQVEQGAAGEEQVIGLTAFNKAMAPKVPEGAPGVRGAERRYVSSGQPMAKVPEETMQPPEVDIQPGMPLEQLAPEQPKISRQPRTFAQTPQQEQDTARWLGEYTSAGELPTREPITQESMDAHLAKIAAMRSSGQLGAEQTLPPISEGPQGIQVGGTFAPVSQAFPQQLALRNARELTRQAQNTGLPIEAAAQAPGVQEALQKYPELTRNPRALASGQTWSTAGTSVVGQPMTPQNVETGRGEVLARRPVPPAEPQNLSFGSPMTPTAEQQARIDLAKAQTAQAGGGVSRGIAQTKGVAAAAAVQGFVLNGVSPEAALQDFESNLAALPPQEKVMAMAAWQDGINKIAAEPGNKDQQLRLENARQRIARIGMAATQDAAHFGYQGNQGGPSASIAAQSQGGIIPIINSTLMGMVQEGPGVGGFNEGTFVDRIVSSPGFNSWLSRRIYETENLPPQEAASLLADEAWNAFTTDPYWKVHQQSAMDQENKWNSVFSSPAGSMFGAADKLKRNIQIQVMQRRSLG